MFYVHCRESSAFKEKNRNYKTEWEKVKRLYSKSRILKLENSSEKWYVLKCSKCSVVLFFKTKKSIRHIHFELSHLFSENIL